MQDWNVVVSVYDQGFVEARRILVPFGPVAKTSYFNVLVMTADDIPAFLQDFRDLCLDRPEILDHYISRVVPASRTFVFQSPDEFEEKALAAVTPFLSELGNQTFYVRMHRRGFAGKISSQGEERFLDEFLLDRLSEAGNPGHIAFDDPDIVIAVETVGQRAGISLWHKDERQRYPFLKLS